MESKYLQLEEENKRLRRAIEELSVLNDLALAIGGSLDSEKIMRSIISRAIRAVDAEQGDISLMGEEEQGNPMHTLVRSMVSSREQAPLHLNQNLLGWMQINKKPLVINEPGSDERFKNVKWDSSIKSVLCVPLMVKSKLAGILTVYNKKDQDGFTESNKRLLSIIAAQSAQIVENVRLYEEEQAYKVVQKELELASDIQKRMLPSVPPHIKGYSIVGKNLTAKSVGGDYFDYVQIDDTHWGVCLGDISGKGMPASLLMSNLQAVLRGQLLHFISPAIILNNANFQLFHNTNPEKFATLFLGILDTKANTLTFASAGHEYPFLIKMNGDCERLESNGVPLGVIETFDYNEQILEVEPGDCIFVYSDGITESMTPEEEEFGEQRLQEVLLSAGEKKYKAEHLIDKVFEVSNKHSQQKQLFDDMTALVITREP